jgi:hypothetical protein
MAQIPGSMYTHGKKNDMIKQTTQIKRNGIMILWKDAYPVFCDTWIEEKEEEFLR